MERWLSWIEGECLERRLEHSRGRIVFRHLAGDMLDFFSEELSRHSEDPLFAFSNFVGWCYRFSCQKRVPRSVGFTCRPRMCWRISSANLLRDAFLERSRTQPILDRCKVNKKVGRNYAKIWEIGELFFIKNRSTWIKFGCFSYDGAQADPRREGRREQTTGGLRPSLVRNEFSG